MSEQMSLPFEIITAVAGRTYLRNNYTVGSRVSYKIPFKDIQLRGSNQRKVFDNIPELASSILKHSQQEPFELDILPDGRAFLKEGERRYRAYLLLIEQGSFNENDLVEFFPTKSNITELDRMVQQYTSNSLKETFKPLEVAGVAFNIKYNFGEEKSNEEVAELMGNISRQTVDNLITLFKAPDDIKDQIKTGLLNVTAALRLIHSQEKNQKAADKAEEESHKTTQSPTSLPKDALKDEVAELAAAEEQAQLYREREANRKRIEESRLQVIANLVPVDDRELKKHEGKRLAADAIKSWKEDFVDEETGEAVPVERNTVVLKQNELINQESIDLLINQNVEQVYIFKEIIAAESKITEPVAQPEKSKYDLSRPEVSAVQKAIQGADKIEAIVTKLDVPDDVKKDITFQVYWLQRNLEEAREYIHINKKQNKRDR